MSWICKRCDTENSDDLLVCEVCGYAPEEEAWENVLKTNTATPYDQYIAYDQYLRKYPSGKHKIEAKRKLDALKLDALKEQKRRKKRPSKRIGFIGVTIAIIAAAIVLKNTNLTNNPTNTHANSSMNVGVKVTPKPNQTTTKNTNVEINHNEENNNVESINKSDDKTIDVAAIERKLEKKIKGMEIAKQNGDPVNPEILREARSLLNEIESSSSKYSSFRDRINNLIQ